MNEGDALPIRRTAITAAPMRTIAEVLRDPNPIHLDPAAAGAAGLGDRVINQGPANLAYVVDAVQAAFPNHRLAMLDSSYLSSVRDGDVVEAGGTILSITPDAITCDTWLRVKGGATAVKAVATLSPRVMQE